MIGYDQLVPSKGHHDLTGPYVEYLGATSLSAEEKTLFLTRVQTKLTELISAGLETTWRHVPYDEIKTLCGGSVPTYLPVGGSARMMWIAGEDSAPCPCGGTHVKNTADLGQDKVRLVKLKKAKNALRVRYDVDE